MKVCITIDSFKGSLSTMAAAKAAAKGVRRAYPDAEIETLPLADGGEGTVDAITAATGGRLVTVAVTGPLGKPIKATYGIIPDTNTAVIEIAAAAGLTLVPTKSRNPLYTTTFGVGELILHAIEGGCRKFIIGLGGSATNDGGAGMLSALGVKLLDSKGAPIKQGASGLRDLAEIRTDTMNETLKKCRFSVACDVKNPLCGKEGASFVFGPQKGATEMSASDMDKYLHRFAELTAKQNPKADPDYPGAGAAGGLGFAFLSYLGAKMRPGIEIVADAIGLEEKIKAADIVLTGEGRIDGQSAMGKAPVGVAKIAKKLGKPVIVIAGSVGEGAELCHAKGVDAIFPILRSPITLAEAMKAEVAAENLTYTVHEIFRLVRACGGPLKSKKTK